MTGNTVTKSQFSPSFLKSKTPEDLEAKMLMNNMKSGRCFDYRSIQFVNGFWYAWYDRDQEQNFKIVKKDLRGSNG